jgi:nitroreductase
MNDVLKAIHNRRSLRQFGPEQIADAELFAILEAGLAAPSGHGDQPWYFSVVQNRDILKDISDGSKREMQKTGIDWIVNAGKNVNYNIFYDAPTAVIVAARKDAVTPMADVCAAIQNMLIAAESFNIGSCWIGFAKFNFLDGKNNQKMGIPEDYEVYFAVALGYKPDGFKPTPRQKKYTGYYQVIK